MVEFLLMKNYSDDDDDNDMMIIVPFLNETNLPILEILCSSDLIRN